MTTLLAILGAAILFGGFAAFGSARGEHQDGPPAGGCGGASCAGCAFGGTAGNACPMDDPDSHDARLATPAVTGRRG